jgi:hypothetical protein
MGSRRQDPDKSLDILRAWLPCGWLQVKTMRLTVKRAVLHRIGREASAVLLHTDVAARGECEPASWRGMAFVPMDSREACL